MFFLISALAIRAWAGLTPASIKGGGAVRAYRTNNDITSLFWYTHVKNLETF